MRKVFLMGYFGAGNLGDDMLLADFLTAHGPWLAEQGFRADLLSASPDPVSGFSETAALLPHVARSLSKKQCLQLDASSYEALIAPGGSLLQDSTSLRSLLYYLWLIRRFAAAGIPVFMLNQGIGPLRSGIGETYLPELLRACRYVSVRDHESLRLLRKFPQLGRDDALGLSCDPVLAGRLSAAAPDGFSLPIPSRQYIVGILKGNGDHQARAVSKLLSSLAESSGMQVLLVSMHAEQDRSFSQAVAQQLGSTSQVFETEALPAGVPYNSAVISIIANAAFAVSHRLHGLITATAYTVPAFGLAYDPKVQAFCTELGIPFVTPEEASQEPSIALAATTLRASSRVSQDALDRRGFALRRLALSEQEFRQRFSMVAG